jgi:hypothetical protein
VNVKQATKPEDPAGPEPARPKEIRPIPPARIVNVLQVCGEPHRVVLPDDLDPLEVLADERYWGAMPPRLLPAGARIELSNDSGTFLFECWIRGVFGTASTGVRGIRFHHRVVWDERAAGAVAAEVKGTGRWEVRYGGEYYGWQVFAPNGTPMASRFNDEQAAINDMQQRERNPKPR